MSRRPLTLFAFFLSAPPAPQDTLATLRAELATQMAKKQKDLRRIKELKAMIPKLEAKQEATDELQQLVTEAVEADDFDKAEQLQEQADALEAVG